ncbi:hypothetical protein ACFW4X_07200 [Streptomyces smyrnaeus]|uniref:hypothetical protein n=1 Tax=Streptomyces smyrnaeus TaxID=1387713 RepID=UPI00368C6F2C
MTVSPHAPAPAAAHRRKKRFARGLGRRLRDAVTLLPVGLFALVMGLGGRARAARRALRARPQAGAGRVLVHAVLTVLLGVLALIPVAVLTLLIARGPFYGFVDSGPYDDSWGGPSKAGAWLAHFGVSLPLAAVAIGLLYGLAALHRRMTAPLRGERRPVWVLPTGLLGCLAGGLFLVAFVRQLN